VAVNGDSRRDLLALTIRGVVSIAALGGATLLALRGSIESEAIVVLYTTVIALWGSGAVGGAGSKGNGGP